MLRVARCDCRGKGDLHRKLRPAADRRYKRELVIEHPRYALHNGKSEPQAAGDLGAPLEPVEFLENGLLLRRRNAKTGVMNVDTKVTVPAAASDEHATLEGVLDRVRHQVLQEPPQ